MSYTNSTPNYNLPQWIGTDKPTFLGDFNGAFSAIDTAMKDNADASSAATSTANAANATAISANTNANTALNTANNAKDTADAATAAAAGATSTANTAKTTADNAARAALSNNVSNLAPAYDSTLTYAVGDLVTYIDSNNSGKLYKCIVAVNTPGAFNVNYWDDVTTSEVYSKKEHSVKVGDFTTANTWGDIATAIYNVCLSNLAYINSGTKVILLSDGKERTYNIALIDNTNTAFRFIHSELNDSRLSVLSFDLESGSQAYIIFAAPNGVTPSISIGTSGTLSSANEVFLIMA